jgi:hypothetical protein
MHKIICTSSCFLSRGSRPWRPCSDRRGLSGVQLRRRTAVRRWVQCVRNGLCLGRPDCFNTGCVTLAQRPERSFPQQHPSTFAAMARGECGVSTEFLQDAINDRRGSSGKGVFADECAEHFRRITWTGVPPNGASLSPLSREESARARPKPNCRFTVGPLERGIARLD